MQAGQGKDRAQKVRREISWPSRFHSLAVITPKVTSSKAMTACMATPAFSSQKKTEFGMNPMMTPIRLASAI